MSVEISITDQIVEINEVSNPVEISVAAGAIIAPVWGGITGTLSNQTDLQNALNAKFDDPTGTTAQYIRGDGTLATFPSLTGYVPYTGATTNVNLGEFELRAGQMTLDTSPTGTAAVGTTRWNDTIGSSETTLKGGSVILKNGVDLVARVVNKVSPNTTLTKAAYQAVRVSGAQGQRLAVDLAQANNDNNSADTIGLVTETIATNQEGFIITVGHLENINTTGSLQGETWADGDVIYLSPTTAGRLTNIKPIAPNHIIIIGYVEYAHANNGKLYVKVMNGWELGELHDVDTTGATNGQVLKYNGTIWTPSSDVGITSLNGLNATTQTFATGSSGTDFNISSATSTHTFNLPTASGTNRGLLSSADWTTFNSKQNALTNPITGTGTSGQVAYFTGSTTQAGSNNLFWDATNSRLGIGTATPTSILDVTISANAKLIFQNSSQNNLVVSGTNASLILNTTSGSFPAVRLQVAGSSVGGIEANGTSSIDLVSLVSTIPITFRQVGTERARFHASTGNFGIGTGATDSGQKLQVVGTGYFSGSVGIGNSATASSNLRISKNIDTNNTIGIYMDSTIQNTMPNVGYFQSQAATAASITVTHLRHFFATQPVFGAGSEITNQYGFAVQGSTLINATNNYGFWGDIAAGTNRWNLYMGGTAANYLAGDLMVGEPRLAGASWSRYAVVGNINFDKVILGYLASSTNGATIGANNGNLNAWARLNVAGSDILFRIAEVEHARLTSSGNLHIGTYVSDTGEKLQVLGNVKIALNQNAATTLTLSNTNSNVSANAYMRVTASGGSIDFGKFSAATNAYKIVSANDGVINNSTVGDLAILNDNASGNIKFAAGGSSTVQMLLNASGNLGLGVTSLTRKFQISGTDINFSATSTSADATCYGVINTATAGNLIYGINRTSSNSLMNGALVNAAVYYIDTNNALQFGTNNTTRATIFGGGNVAIGSTTDSGERLQVTGTAKITDSATFTKAYSNTSDLGVIVNATIPGINLRTASTGRASFIQSYISNGVASILVGTGTNNPTTQAAHFVGSDGAVVIGVWPGSSSGEKLQVEGTAKITSKLSIGAGTISNAQINLASSTAPTSPNNGDIWFDGTDLKMRIGGVTKTFTLV